MSAVRIGRYIRDNTTGEWCIITRGKEDRVTRLQYAAVSSVHRERICLTCASDIFDTGDILASVLFQCHDSEWRRCPTCRAPPVSCTCPSPSVRKVSGLEDAARTVVREGAASWQGTVRVTVLSNLSDSRLMDMDECMKVRASYCPSLDRSLAAEMQRLAIFQTVRAATRVPAALGPPAETEVPTQHSFSPYPTQEALEDGLSFDEIFGTEEGEVPDHFLMPPPPTFSDMEEVVMLPADPSTLPGGVHFCLEGMLIQDDWASFISEQPDPLAGSPTGSTDFTSASASSAVGSLKHEDSTCISPMLSSPTTSVSLPHSPGALDIDMLPRNIMPEFEALSVDAKPAVDAEVTGTPCMDCESVLAPLSDYQALEIPCEEPQSTCLSSAAAAMSEVSPPELDSSVSGDSVVAPKEEDLDLVVVEEKPTVKASSRRLAPRPAGMNVTNSYTWQMGVNHVAMNAHLEALEKERKAEERRKKNREAAARSNARKKGVMDGIKAQINEAKACAARLKEQQVSLRLENQQLKERLAL